MTQVQCYPAATCWHSSYTHTRCNDVRCIGAPAGPAADDSLGFRARRMVLCELCLRLLQVLLQLLA